MSTIIDKIEANLSTYGNSQKHLAKFIINNHDSIPNMTITALAKSAYCSPSSVSRFVTKLGYDSYYDFCHSLKFDSIQNSKFSSVTASMNEINTILETHQFTLLDYKNVFLYCDSKIQNLVLDCVDNQNIIDQNNLLFTSDNDHNFNLLKFASSEDIIIIINSSRSKTFNDFDKINQDANILILDIFSSLQIQEYPNIKHIKFLSNAKYDQLQQKFYVIQILNALFYN